MPYLRYRRPKISPAAPFRRKQRSRIILASVINMANSLGMDVITEGVETEQQLRALVAMGCESFQGYYFSRPITVEAFEEMLEKR